MQSLTYGQLLRSNRPFRNLLAGQVISELGNWFNFIASLGLVRFVSGASPTVSWIVICVTIDPVCICVADRRHICRSIFPQAGDDRDGHCKSLCRPRIFVGHLEQDLWIAYLATISLTFGAFFEGAKNAATPNLTGKEGLFAGTALMFSSRFLLMAVGSALGGWAAADFWVQDCVSDKCRFVSRIRIIRCGSIPESATRDAATAERMSAKENS